MNEHAQKCDRHIHTHRRNLYSLNHEPRANALGNYIVADHIELCIMDKAPSLTKMYVGTTTLTYFVLLMNPGENRIFISSVPTVVMLLFSFLAFLPCFTLHAMPPD